MKIITQQRKRLLSCLLAFAMILSVFSIMPLSASAAEPAAGGTEFKEGALTYTVNNWDTTTVTVSGYDDTIETEVVIPDNVTYDKFQYTVTNITASTSVFRGNANIISLNISGSISSVPMNSFRDCTSLQKVTLNEGTTSIVGAAFMNDTALTDIVFPDSLTTIAASAFKNTGLVNVTLKNITIAASFNDCTSLEKIEIYENVITSSTPFKGCSAVEDVYFFDKEMAIPDTILDGANSNLTVHGFKGSNAEEYANNKNFAFEPFEEIEPTDPTEVPATPDETAPDETEPDETTPEETEPDETEPDETTPEETEPDETTPEETEPDETTPEETEPSTVPAPWLPEVGTVIKQSPLTYTVTNIEQGSLAVSVTGFDNSTTVVTIPESITENDFTFKVTDIANSVFQGNTSITSVSIPGTVKSIAGSCFKDCTSLEKVTLNNGIEEIGGSVFRNTALTDITFPDSMTNIGRWSFRESKLQEVTLKNVTIDSLTFGNCTDLKTIHIYEGVLLASPSAPFKGCTAIKDVYFYDAEMPIHNLMLVETNSTLTVHGYKYSTAADYAALVLTAPQNPYDKPAFNFVPFDPDTTLPSTEPETTEPVTEPSPTETEPSPTETEPSPTETEPSPTETTPVMVTYLLGDSDCNGDVNVKDATNIQLKAAHLLTDDQPFSKLASDIDFNGDVNVFDATQIQMWGAKFEVDYPIGELITVPEPTEPEPTVPEPTTEPEPVPEPEIITFYVVNAAGWLNNDGCKLWVYNNATDEFEAAIEYDEFEKAYIFEIPSDWTDLSYYRTAFDVTEYEFDINNKYDEENNPTGVIYNEWHPSSNRGDYDAFRVTADGEGEYANIEDEVFELRKVYFDNSVTNWSEVYIYGWDASIGLVNTTSTKMVDEGNGIWSYTFRGPVYPTAGAKSFLFVNKMVTNAGSTWSGAVQTVDIAIEANKNLCVPTSKNNAGKYEYIWDVYTPAT